MTFCVPKRPFEIAQNILYHIFVWLWIPTSGILVYNFIYYNTFPFLAPIFAVTIGISLAVWISWFINTNEKKHWIKWCDKK